MIDLFELALSVTPEQLPNTFEIGPCQVVVNRAAWLAAIQLDVRCGPRGPRARTGVLYRDLRKLHDVVSR